MFTSKQTLLIVTEVLCVTPAFPLQLRHAVGAAFVPRFMNKKDSTSGCHHSVTDSQVIKTTGKEGFGISPISQICE